MNFQYTEISDDGNQVYWIFQSFSERGPNTRVMVWIFPTTGFFQISVVLLPTETLNFKISAWFKVNSAEIFSLSLPL